MDGSGFVRAIYAARWEATIGVTCIFVARVANLIRQQSTSRSWAHCSAGKLPFFHRRLLQPAQCPSPRANYITLNIWMPVTNLTSQHRTSVHFKTTH